MKFDLAKLMKERLEKINKIAMDTRKTEEEKYNVKNKRKFTFPPKRIDEDSFLYPDGIPEKEFDDDPVRDMGFPDYQSSEDSISEVSSYEPIIIEKYHEEGERVIYILLAKSSLDKDGLRKPYAAFESKDEAIKKAKDLKKLDLNNETTEFTVMSLALV